MDHQRELVRRLCNGALAQILHDSSQNANNSSNADSILNTLLINTLGNFILKRRTNKSTQTDFNVQRINAGAGGSSSNLVPESQHLLPLCKLQQQVVLHVLPSSKATKQSSRKNCIR